MIYLPWITFLFAVLWMIRQGDKAKTEYLIRKTLRHADQVVGEVGAGSKEAEAELKKLNAEIEKLLKSARTAQKPRT